MGQRLSKNNKEHKYYLPLHFSLQMKQILYTILLLTTLENVIAKTIGQSVYGNLKNKAELVVIKDTNTDFRLSMNVKVAPFIETIENAGISRLLMYTIYTNLVRLDSSYENTELIFNPDYSSFIFHLDSKSYSVERILSNIYKSVLVDSAVLEQAKVLTIKSYEQQHIKTSIETFELENQMQQYIWGDNHFKRYQRIEETAINNLSGKQLLDVYIKYFKPSNSLFILRGMVNPETKFTEIDETTLYEDRIENNYVPIGKTNIYKSLISSSQLIHNDESHANANKAILSYQITGNYQNKNGYGKLMILCHLLNKISIKVFPEVKDLVFSLKTEKYAAEFSASYTPSSLQKVDFYNMLQGLNSLSFDSIISQKEYSDLLLEIVANNELEKRVGSSFEKNILHWWNTQSIDNYVEFESTIKSIASSDIMNTYNKYLRNCHFVLMINNNNMVHPGEEFALESVDDTSVESTFFYEYNISDLTRESEKEKLWKVLQWLYINKNLSIQVNGHADRDEYLKADASELKEFINQYPQFKVVSSKIGKGTWQRLDMVRSIKVAKFLIDNGIDFNRVKGSGLLLDSEDKEHMQENQKVDFSYQLFRIDQE